MEKQTFKRRAWNGIDTGFEFMSWEQNASKRNINNTVKFHLNNDLTVNVGDELIGDSNAERKSVYTITEVLEVRPSNMKGKNYVTVKTVWEMISRSN